MTLPAPDVHDLLLLRFLVGHVEDASALWDEWATERDLDDHTAVAFELFPAVHSRLAALEIDHPWRARLKGVYRRAWVEQQQAEAAADAAASSLAGSVPFLHTFASDLRLHAGDAILGRATDPRLTVRNTDAHRAYAALLDAGWQSHSPRRFRHRIVTRVRRFQRGDHNVQIATTPTAGAPNPTYNKAVWNRAISTDGGLNRSLEDTTLKVLLHEPDNRDTLWWAFAALTLTKRVGRSIDVSAALPPVPDLRDVVSARLQMIEQLVATMAVDEPYPTATVAPIGEQTGSSHVASLLDVAERWLGPRKLVTFSRLELTRRG